MSTDHFLATYSGSLAALRPLGCEFLLVPTDENGIIPDKLEQVLKERKHANKPLPKVGAIL